MKNSDSSTDNASWFAKLRDAFRALGILQRSALVLAAWVVLVVLAYVEEDWRGRRAWENYKADAAAHGQILNWAAWMPAPVPADENIFAAPNMQQWFVGRGNNSLSSRLTFQQFIAAIPPTSPVAELTVVPASATVYSADADIVLALKYSSLNLDAIGESATASVPPPEPIPVIVMDTVPLADVIKNLARQANIKYVLDPSVFGPDSGGPNICSRWTNLSAEELLVSILKDQGLQLIPDPKTGVARVVKKNPNAPAIQSERAVGRELSRLLRAAVNATPKAGPEVKLTAATGFVLTVTPPGAVKPMGIVVRSDRMPDLTEVRDFFPKNPLGLPPGSPYISEVQVLADGTNSFHILLNPPSAVAAMDYLAWSDSFQPEFDIIREALQRPFARMEGDYDHPEMIPVPNFVCIRQMAQMLGQRTQCYLLLGEPEKALRELTMLYDLCRLLEARPTGKPMTLVAAMINVAVRGIYVSTLGDGMRLRVWREPQLVALQKQLEQTDLESSVATAFAFESVAHARLLETHSASELVSLFTQSSTLTPLEKFKDPTYLFYTLAPRGWVFQNGVVAGNLESRSDEFDLSNRVIFPRKVDKAVRDAEQSFQHISAYNYLASTWVPNFSRAVQNLARNQTLVNEAAIVCALERYRIARQEYPESLNTLSPAFMEKLPHDIIGGGPLHYRRESEKFVLYAIGWDEKDDGGVAGFKADFTGDLTKNDWVWPFNEAH